ncbi:cyd operon YbgE family protein [Azotobacter beijerinckii]|uniref:cyd operon YbgE family protein n=1 Tax=Azotobacter beijerinckii TaxID=170623 RepID=UPI002954C88C|nr:cyd operon YbgE family protein [Azotobacter beijerinckii]MDV7210922.1 cyd operon YbgE family protein [Azotobacter beijerinckii]
MRVRWVTTEKRLLQRWPLRTLSLLLASPLALILLIHPSMIVDPEAGYSHSLLMLVMLGISSGFIHGVGFDPRGLIWRILFHPVGGWVLMGLGYAVLYKVQMG